MGGEQPPARRPPLVVGLTGGIGSGKSLVSDLFARRGVEVIDTDLISRQLVQPGSEGLQALVAAFGRQILAEDGTLDRATMRLRVFSDDQARARLESILHPRIRAEVERRLQAAAGDRYALVVIPLLAERGDGYSLDRVVVVDADDEVRRQRVAGRDRLPAEQIERIFAAQATRSARVALADDLIVNNGSIEEVESVVDRLHRHYLATCEEATV